MADIGSTLRETRIRNKIDISSVEQAIKIRAKYLRALENEEFSVLPGPTYVKSFLRTYAEHLGLDAHLLVEEYSARFEEPEELELPAFGREESIRDRVRTVQPPSRGAAAIALLVAFVGFLFVLGLLNDHGKKSTGGSSRAARQAARQIHRRPASQSPGPTKSRRPQRPAASGGFVRLEVVPSRPVWVCLADSKGNLKIDGQVLAAGDVSGPYRSKSFKITVGNGGGDFKVDGRMRDVPESAEPQSYSVAAGKVRSLSVAQGPGCG